MEKQNKNRLQFQFLKSLGIPLPHIASSQCLHNITPPLKMSGNRIRNQPNNPRQLENKTITPPQENHVTKDDQHYRRASIHRVKCSPIPKSNDTICEIGIVIIWKGTSKPKICKLQISFIVYKKIRACGTNIEHKVCLIISRHKNGDEILVCIKTFNIPMKYLIHMTVVKPRQ